MTASTTTVREFELRWPDGVSYLYGRRGQWKFTEEEARNLACYEGNLTILDPAGNVVGEHQPGSPAAR
jgi:hypothetical protein